MDSFFQGLYGCPTLENELEYHNKQQQIQIQKKKVPVLDILEQDFSIHNFYRYSDEQFLHMRLQTILSFWPDIQ